jgi:uncharacterized protein
MAPLKPSAKPRNRAKSDKAEVTAEEVLRYAMSLPVATTITGIETLQVLRQDLKIAQNFKPMPESEMASLRNRTKQSAADGHFDLYKVSLKFDNPEARLAHDFPLGDQQAEVKEMMKNYQNTGKPFPAVK